MADEAKQPPNTTEQRATHQAAEAAWAEEQTWPVWDVHLQGDETEWVARPGRNLDEDGEPQPWVAPAECRVRLRAKSAAHAGALALRAEPAYHTVVSTDQVGDGATAPADDDEE